MGGFVSYEYAWHFFKLTYRTYEYRSSGFAKQITPMSFISCYDGSLIARMVVSFTTEFKTPVFFAPGFALCYAMNMNILLPLYDICLLTTQICYIILYIQKVPFQECSVPPHVDILFQMKHEHWEAYHIHRMY